MKARIVLHSFDALAAAGFSVAIQGTGEATSQSSDLPRPAPVPPRPAPGPARRIRAFHPAPALPGSLEDWLDYLEALEICDAVPTEPDTALESELLNQRLARGSRPAAPPPAKGNAVVRR